jgi:hypothetical protein
MRYIRRHIECKRAFTQGIQPKDETQKLWKKAPGMSADASGHFFYLLFPLLFAHNDCNGTHQAAEAGARFHRELRR